MARIFITGSADGLGRLAAQRLIASGHRVVMHARNDQRAKTALQHFPGAEAVLVADLAKMEEVKQLAEEVNRLGSFDAVIHNAGVYKASREQIFAVNTLAPFILTSLIDQPKRLVYLSSDMHRGGNARLENLEHATTYSDSKFQVLLLAKAIARRWPSVFSNAIDPGWVPTKMGGAGASDNLEEGYTTQVWLATSEDEKAKVSGKYFFHLKQALYAPQADNTTLQDEYIVRCEQISGIKFQAF